MNLTNIKYGYFDGISTTCGSELERTTNDVKWAKENDKELWELTLGLKLNQGRYSQQVCEHFGWEEYNVGVTACAHDRLFRNVYDYIFRHPSKSKETYFVICLGCIYLKEYFSHDENRFRRDINWNYSKDNAWRDVHTEVHYEYTKDKKMFGDLLEEQNVDYFQLVKDGYWKIPVESYLRLGRDLLGLQSYFKQNNLNYLFIDDYTGLLSRDLKQLHEVGKVEKQKIKMYDFPTEQKEKYYYETNLKEMFLGYINELDEDNILRPEGCDSIIDLQKKYNDFSQLGHPTKLVVDKLSKEIVKHIEE